MHAHNGNTNPSSYNHYSSSSVSEMLSFWTLDTIRAVRTKVSKSSCMEDLFNPYHPGGPTPLSSPYVEAALSQWRSTIASCSFVLDRVPNRQRTVFEHMDLYRRNLVMTDIPLHILSDLYKIFTKYSPKTRALAEAKISLRAQNAVGFYVIQKPESQMPSSSCNGSITASYYVDTPQGRSSPVTVSFAYSLDKPLTDGVTSEYLFELELLLRSYGKLMADFVHRAYRARLNRIFCLEYRVKTYFEKYNCQLLQKNGGSWWLSQLFPVSLADYEYDVSRVSTHMSYMSSVLQYTRYLERMVPFSVADLLPAAAADVDHLVFLVPTRAFCSLSYLGVPFMPLTMKSIRNKVLRYDTDDFDKTMVVQSLVKKLTSALTDYVNAYKETLASSTDETDSLHVPPTTNGNGDTSSLVLPFEVSDDQPNSFFDLPLAATAYMDSSERDMQDMHTDS